MSFENQVVVITGGNSGIGRGVAERFHAEGASIVVFGRNSETLADTVNALGDRATAITGDVSRLDDLDVLAEEVRNNHGKVDHLVVNAGVAKTAPIEAVDEAAWDQTMDINLKGAFFTIQKLLPLMNQGGSITLVASAVIYKGFANFSVYSASKAGLASLARTLSAELNERGIRVNSVNPGPIETPIFGKMGVPSDQIDGMKSGFSELVPLKRFGRVNEVAGAVRFLASPDASYMTGTQLNVDGGISDM